MVRLVYARTTSGSPMRNLILDLYTHGGTPSFLTKAMNGRPADFTSDLTIRLLEKRKRPEIDHTWTGDASKYMEAVGKADP